MLIEGLHFLPRVTASHQVQAIIEKGRHHYQKDQVPPLSSKWKPLREFNTLKGEGPIQTIINSKLQPGRNKQIDKSEP